MKRKYHFVIVVIVLIIVLLTGCGNKADETTAQDSLVEEGTTPGEPVDDRIIDLSDYSAYLKKIWIEKGWSSKDHGWSNSLVITKIENGHIEGYYGSVRDDYFSLSVGQDGLYPFNGVIYDGVAECEYVDVRNNPFTIIFYENDYIRVERDAHRSDLLRPYHVSDWQFCGEPITYEVELDSWGTVTLFYANLEDRHSYPWVLLLDGQGNILYKFPGRFQIDSKVSEVVIEDVNGDGLKDVEVITCMNGSDKKRAEWYFEQLEDGLFYLGKCNGNGLTDIPPFLNFDWTAQEVLFHPITPMDSARGWVFFMADVDFDGSMEMLIAFTAVHCGDNSLYIYKQDEEKVFALADTYATFREDIDWRSEGYEELSPYLAIDLLDAYVNEESEYRYLSLDYTYMGAGLWGGYGELRLYVTTLDPDAQPMKLAEIQFNENESFEGMEIFFQEERVDEPEKLHELLEQYMDGYTKAEIEYKTLEVSFPRDIVSWNENEKRQCLEDLYESLEDLVSRPTSYEMPVWQTAYAEYIEGVDYAHYNKYALIYVDDDDIPELVIYTGTYATACLILTFHNGEVDALQTGSLQCNYIEKKNILLDAGGQMGEFFDHLYSIENGKWVYVTGGEYIAKFDEDGWIPDVYDYEWDGKAVTEDIYSEKLRAVWDWEQNQNVPMEQYDTLDEMLLRLQM